MMAYKMERQRRTLPMSGMPINATDAQ